MAVTEEAYLLRCWDAGICPYCGNIIPVGARVGTGRIRDGGFCSLDCFARYRQLEMSSKLALLAKRVKSDE